MDVVRSALNVVQALGSYEDAGAVSDEYLRADLVKLVE